MFAKETYNVKEPTTRSHPIEMLNVYEFVTPILQAGTEGGRDGDDASSSGQRDNRKTPIYSCAFYRDGYIVFVSHTRTLFFSLTHTHTQTHIHTHAHTRTHTHAHTQ